MGCLPSVVFGVAMLEVGALYFYQAYVGRTVPPTWPIRVHLFDSEFHMFSKFGKASVRQARVAQTMLRPGALFHAETFAFLSCAPHPAFSRSLMSGFPKVFREHFWSKERRTAWNSSKKRIKSHKWNRPPPQPTTAWRSRGLPEGAKDWPKERRTAWSNEGLLEAMED